MEVIIVLFTIVAGILLCCLNKNKFARRVSLLFFLIWCFLLILSIFNPNNLKPVSPVAYLYISTFVLMVLTGLNFYNVSENTGKISSYNTIPSAFNHIATNKWMLTVLIIADLFLIFFCFQLRDLLEKMSALDYRNTGGLQNFLFDGNSIIGLTYTFLVTPMTFFSNIFLAYLILFNRKAIFPIILYAIFIVLRSYLEGQRSGLVDVFIFIAFFIFCCPFFISDKKNKKTVRVKMIKNIFFIGIISLAAFSILSFMTNQRLHNENEFSMNAVSDGANDTFNHLLIYSIGPFRALDYAIDNNYIGRLHGYAFGRSTFGFVDYSLQLILNNLGIKYNTANGHIYKLLQDNWISIPNDFNFAYTAIFNFYIDFGFLGVLIIPFILGALVKILIIKFTNTCNPITLLAIAYLFYVLINSYFTWRMYDMSAMVTIIWLFIFKRMLKNHV